MSFERTPLTGTTLDDLDRAALSGFLKQRGGAFREDEAALSDDQRAEKLGLVEHGNLAGCDADACDLFRLEPAGDEDSLSGGV